MGSNWSNLFSEDNNLATSHAAANMEPQRHQTLKDSYWFKVNPSAAIKESGVRIPFKPRKVLNRKGIDYDSNTPHLIAAGNGSCTKEKKVHIHIPGTGSSPSAHHVGSDFMKTAHSAGWASISLSYEWANYADQEKNTECERAGNPACQRMLSAYHRDVCFGGSTSPLTATHLSGSVVGRIGALLLYLAVTRPEEEGWRDFLTSEASSLIASTSASEEVSVEDVIRSVNWSAVVLTGHSQGAGHVAYIAQQIEVGRVVLFSGPQEGYVTAGGQEEGETTAHWLEADFKTKSLFAMMHAEEEGTADLIRYCWSKISILRPYQKDGNVLCIRDIGDALSAQSVRLSSSHLIETSLPPFVADVDARPNHNSLTTDRTTPVVAQSDLPKGVNNSYCEEGDNRLIPVYSFYVWPFILGCS